MFNRIAEVDRDLRLIFLSTFFWGFGLFLYIFLQPLFFGLGAYGFAMYLKLNASGGKLPDFMFWSGLTELPWFWAPFANPIFAIVAALLIPTLLAALRAALWRRSSMRRSGCGRIGEDARR